MEVTINSIRFTSIVVTEIKEKKCDFEIRWMLNNSTFAEYKGIYTWVIYEDGTEIASKEFRTEGNSLKKELSISEINFEKMYEISLFVGKKSSENERRESISCKDEIFVDYFTDISGVYDGESLSLKWKISSQNAHEGICKVICSDKDSDDENSYTKINPYTITPTDCYIKINSIFFPPSKKLKISFYISNKFISKGLESEILRFNTSGITICSAQLEQKQSESISELTLNLKYSYNDLEKIRVYCKLGQNIIAVSEPVDVKASEENEYNCTIKLPYDLISFETLQLCEVYCIAVYGSAESHLKAIGDSIPMLVPKLCVDNIEKDKIHVSVCSDYFIYPPIGYELPDNRLISNSQFIADMPTKNEFQLRLCPRYDINGIKRTGPYSNTITAFTSGYYPDCDEKGNTYITFYKQKFSEKEISLDFNFKIKEEISNEILSLKASESGCSLIINTEKPLLCENLDGFLCRLSSELEAYEFYKLCDCILRTATYYIKDTSYLQCSFNPKKHIADIRPGMVLYLATSIYQPQYSSYMDNTAGFSAMYSNYYPVSMREENEYLEFDCFSNEMAKYLNVTSSAETRLNKIIYASGIKDLLQPAARQPYYRLLYPKSFSSETVYPSDNIIILAADSYNSILKSCTTIEEDINGINNLTIPIILFRGNSTLSLYIPIIIGSEKSYVPVGSTLEDVLQQYGIYRYENIKMFRYDLNGLEKPVFLQLFDQPEKITLISGDHIYLF